MKLLLRVLLVIDALLLLAGGLLFVLTPWKGLYDALQLVPVDPAMVGQAFGIALLGLAWLSFHASVNGGMTSGVARAVGHVNWLIGVLMVVWLIGLHRPELTAFGQLVSVVLFVIGLIGVRLSSAVRRRERVQLVEAKASAVQPAPVVVPPQPDAVPVEPAAARMESGIDAKPVVQSGRIDAVPSYAPPATPGSATDSRLHGSSGTPAGQGDPPVHG
ncbi:MAG: hypothetical protein VB142_08880 [Burkholderia sp.]